MDLKVALLFVIEGMPDYEQMLKQAGLEVEMVKEISVTEEDINAAEVIQEIIGGVPAVFDGFQ